jgi:hypothetical protein
MSGVKTEYPEISTEQPSLRQSHDAGREAQRKLAMVVRDLRGEPLRASAGTSSTVAAKFGQTVLADATSAQVDVALPSTTPDDIGRRVVIKLWSGSPGFPVLVHAPADGRIDGNQYWRLNQAMEAIMVEYEGNNDWAIIASVPGVGGLVVAGIIPSPITLP